jgi:hypothetical protein
VKLVVRKHQVEQAFRRNNPGVIILRGYVARRAYLKLVRSDDRKRRHSLGWIDAMKLPNGQLCHVIAIQHSGAWKYRYARMTRMRYISCVAASFALATMRRSLVPQPVLARRWPHLSNTLLQIGRTEYLVESSLFEDCLRQGCNIGEAFERISQLENRNPLKTESGSLLLAEDGCI